MNIGKNMRFTRVSLIEMGVGGAFFILALIFLIGGCSNWKYNSNFRDALYYYDSNQVDKVSAALEAAIQADPKSPYPRELLAKHKVESGDFEEADKLYTRLIEMGFDRETVYVGLAINHLKAADQEEKAEKAIDHVKKAMGYLKKARDRKKDCPEIAIAEATAALITAIKGGKANLDGFDPITVDTLGRATPEGLLDYYAGSAKSLRMRNKGPDEVRRHLSRAYIFFGASEAAMINRLNEESRFYKTEKIEYQDLLARKTDLEKFFNEVNTIRINNPQLYKNLEEPLINFLCAVAMAFGRHGDPLAASSFTERGRSTSAFTKRLPEPYIVEGLCFDMASNNPKLGLDKQLDHRQKARTMYEQLLSERILGSSPEETRVGAILNNNIAVYLEYDAMRYGTADFRNQAVQRILQANEGAAPDYVFSRNMAILLKKQNRLDEAMKAMQKAREAFPKEGAPPEWKQDLANLEKYFEVR